MMFWKGEVHHINLYKHAIIRICWYDQDWNSFIAIKTGSNNQPVQVVLCLLIALIQPMHEQIAFDLYFPYKN